MLSPLNSAPRCKFLVPAYNLKGVGDDADRHELLSIVAAVHHERVGKALNDGAIGLSEPLGSITASRVGYVNWRPDLDVIAIIRAEYVQVSCRSCI